MLTLTHVTKTFNKGTVNEKPALTGVDLHLEPGDFVTVIGGNGAGKSTLLNCIAGVFPPDGGTIELDGRDVTRLPEHRRVADKITTILPEVEFRGVIRRNVALYSIGMPEWPAPGFMTEERGSQ